MKHIYLLVLTFSLLVAANVMWAQDVIDQEVKSLRIEKTQDIKLYPNPALDKFSLKDTSPSIKYITINNIIGKKIRRIVVNANNSYDVSDLRRGIYIVRIFDTGDNLVKALRLSKN